MGKTQVFEEICSEKRQVNADVLKQTVSWPSDRGEGREGRKIGRSSSSGFSRGHEALEA